MTTEGTEGRYQGRCTKARTFEVTLEEKLFLGFIRNLLGNIQNGGCMNQKHKKMGFSGNGDINSVLLGPKIWRVVDEWETRQEGLLAQSKKFGT